MNELSAGVTRPAHATTEGRQESILEIPVKIPDTPEDKLTQRRPEDGGLLGVCPRNAKVYTFGGRGNPYQVTDR